MDLTTEQLVVIALIVAVLALAVNAFTLRRGVGKNKPPKSDLPANPPQSDEEQDTLNPW